MKQSPEYMETIRVAASMPANQKYERDTVLRLLSHIETTEQSEHYWMAEYEKQSEHIRRLIDNVAQLVKEKEQLESKATVDLPVLPKDIADALEQFRKEAIGFSDDYLAWSIPYGDKPTATTAHRTLGEYSASKGCFFPLVNALQYGYTVDESPEDQVYQKYVKLIDNDQYDAADAILLTIKELIPDNTELLERLQAVERPPF